MKTKLPKRSLEIKERLDAIVKEILAVAKNELAMIILFGSYARGTWVIDSYMEGHITYSYVSDIDIMLVTKSPKFAGFKGRFLESRIEDRLKSKGLNDMLRFTPRVTLITETIAHLNKELEKNRYFFSDIKKEGILLYDSGEFKLAEPKELSWEERKEIAQEYYDQWFSEGVEFLVLTNFSVTNKMLNKAAFLLHQATESLYNAVLLVFSGYKGRDHDIEKLGSLASNYNDELLKIFPRDTEEQKRCFKLLREAYIKACYDKTYKITEEELLYLIQRVEKLKAVTEEICQAWINQGIEASAE
jgi:predicted nucleotidyltransferase/HEPN domain-containing protein